MQSIVKPFLFIIILTFVIGCKTDKPVVVHKTSFEELSSSYTKIDFNNLITETKDNNHLVWESIYNGAGVGVGDINNDGLMDIYFGGNMVADKLYLNKGDFKFEDITDKAGITEPNWTSGINMIDVNGDGYTDIYLSKMSWYRDMDHKDQRANKLYLNQGNNTFVEVAKDYGIADLGHTTQSSFFDFDNDGDLDLYVMNAPSHRYDQKLLYNKQGYVPYEFKDHFYENKDGKFEDKTAKVIGEQDHAYGLGLVTQDLNQDGWVDIYVANDFEKPDLMLINNKQGQFENKIKENLKHISYSSMGMDVADINNDGLYDIGVLDMQSQDHVRSKTNMPSMDAEQFWSNVSKGYHFQFMSNMLQINNGTGFYSEIGQLSNIASTDWSWSLLFADLDNDGYKDITITNGINKNIKDNDYNTMLQNNPVKNTLNLFTLSKEAKIEPIRNFAFKNNKDLTFSDYSSQWNFNKNGFSFGSAHADLDNDGDLDLIVNNSNDIASVYKNNATANYLRVKVVEGNKTLLNATVDIYYNGMHQVGESHNIRGYQSCSEPIIHFGLNNAQKVEKVIVTSLDQKQKTITNVNANQLLIIDMASAPLKTGNTSSKPTILKSDKTVAGIQYFHVENPYNDYDYQVLRPHMTTRNGPLGSVGDLNGDGLDDLYFGSSKGDFSIIYLQGLNGQMVYKPNPSLVADQALEDAGSAFIDIDNDGDLDLYVVSGGSEDQENSTAYKDRLYINDGQANFSRRQLDLPMSNGSVAVPIDINRDGWMDLFVGGRMKGTTYPYPGQSYMLLNDKGTLVIDQNFAYSDLGMVTSVVAKDINNDGREDCIVVGEWMRPTFLINTDSGWENQTDKYIIEDLKGWWYDVEVADINSDGVDEIILGNIGMNNKYKASAMKPLKVYAADYDNDQKSDIVLAKKSKAGDYLPVRGFECSSEQLPFLKDKFNSYSSFANAKIKDLIDIDKKGSLKLEANEFRSGYLKLEEGKYIFCPFPNEAQLSCVRAIHAEDIDDDGSMDLLLAGNLFEAEVETVRHDASIGLLLKNGKNGLKPVPVQESGFYAAGNVRDLLAFRLKNKKAYLVLNNDNKPQLFVR